jgi:hypothetical protein
VFFGPLAFRSIKEFFTGRARYEKRSGTVKGLLLGVCFVAEGPVRRNIFGRQEQEQCRSYQSGSFVIYFKMHRLKDEMTNWPMINCVIIVIICRGHECKFTQAAPCVYKYVNSTPILFTLFGSSFISWYSVKLKHFRTSPQQCLIFNAALSQSCYSSAIPSAFIVVIFGLYLRLEDLRRRIKLPS